MSEIRILGERLLELARGNEQIHPVALDLYHLLGFHERKIADLERALEDEVRKCADISETSAKKWRFSDGSETMMSHAINSVTDSINKAVTKPYGEVLDEMDHQAKYQSATVHPFREQELRIQGLGAAISRRDWHATERAYETIRDKFYARAPKAAEALTLPSPAAMTEEALIFVCDEAACKEDPFFYEVFEMNDRWAIIRAVLKAVEASSVSRPPSGDAA